MILYYRVERDRYQKYIISLYYKNFLGLMREYHRSAHDKPRGVNEVICKYRNDGFRVQSVTTA